MPQKTKKEYFNENIKLNTEGFSYRTFCKRTENISYENWNLVFNTPNYNEYKKSVLPDDAYVGKGTIIKEEPKRVSNTPDNVYDIKKEKEIKVETTVEKKGTPRKRNLIPKKGDEIYEYYMSHPNPGVVYRTFRDKVNSWIPLNQAILKKSQLNKIKRDEEEVLPTKKTKFNKNNPIKPLSTKKADNKTTKTKWNTTKWEKW